MTPPRKRALKILSAAPNGMTAGWFARQMWPEASNRIGKCGPKGSTRGGGARQKAGAFLRRLCDDGLIYSRERSGVRVYFAHNKGESNAVEE